MIFINNVKTKHHGYKNGKTNVHRYAFLLNTTANYLM